MSYKPVASAILNFFLLGLGTLLNGKRKIQGAFLTIGAVLMTYVELTLQTIGSDLFLISFIGFFSLAIAMAYDGYKEGKSLE